ncbi:MAG: staygreen family protein [Romboutsia sp.]|uniref:staygreen family protein n=1 Tax=Romboutsia sp. TaxID=1965302 RepID=UPI003F2C4FC1
MLVDLYAYVGETDFISASIKYGAFKYHMQLALEAIFYGDRDLFINNPEFINTPVYVKFDSSIPMFNNYESYGYVKNYLSIK